MMKSNIFAYVELSKLVSELDEASAETLKNKLLAQSAYFNIIEPRYFSEALILEWQTIVEMTRQRGAKVDEEGNVVVNATAHTIEGLTFDECRTLVDKLYQIHRELQLEFE